MSKAGKISILIVFGLMISIYFFWFSVPKVSEYDQLYSENETRVEAIANELVLLLENKDGETFDIEDCDLSNGAFIDEVSCEYILTIPHIEAKTYNAHVELYSGVRGDIDYLDKWVIALHETSTYEYGDEVVLFEVDIDGNFTLIYVLHRDYIN